MAKKPAAPPAPKLLQVYIATDSGTHRLFASSKDFDLGETITARVPFDAIAMSAYRPVASCVILLDEADEREPATYRVTVKAQRNGPSLLILQPDVKADDEDQ